MADRRAEIAKTFDYALDREKSARKLRDDVSNSSSESSRIMQTLGHLAGKEAGEASDAAIRHRENIKESMAEDDEEGARQLIAKSQAMVRADNAADEAKAKAKAKLTAKALRQQ